MKEYSLRAQKSVDKLKEKFKILKEEAKQDCKELSEENLRADFGLSSLKSKWLNYQQEFSFKLDSLEQTRLQVRRDLFEYYTRDYDYKLSGKDELELFISSDERYIYHLQLKSTMESLIEYCKSTIKILEQKQWEMKSYIDWIKFIEGVS